MNETTDAQQMLKNRLNYISTRGYGSSNIFVDARKSIFAYRACVLVTVLKDDLPSSKKCI